MPTTITDNPELAANQQPQADPAREYVAGGHLSAAAMYRRALPHWIDPNTQDFGDDLYERMLLDPQVESCVEILKKAVLDNGVRLLPAVGEVKEGDPNFPRYQQAVAIRDFCQRNLDRLERPLREVLLNMLDALALGNKVAEQLYEVGGEGEDAGRLLLRALKVKPRRVVAFVVDTYMNVVGLLALIPTLGGATLGGGLVADTARNLLPRRKFAVLTYQGKDGDPRGVSILRSSYNAWWLKMQAWSAYNAYLAQFGSPSLIATLPEKAVPQQQLDADGAPVFDNNGRPVLVYPQTAMLETAQEVRNGSVAVLPFGATLRALEMQHIASPFTDAINLYDRQMAKGILCQTLATEQAEHQARSASQTHQDILGLVIGDAAAAVAAMLRADVLTPLVEYNFPREWWGLVPQVSLAATEQQDFAAVGKTIADLTRAGFIDDSQKSGLDALLGLPERTEVGEDEGEGRE